ncbi:hypothetical protein V9T40_007307 [Parthenolecanium corni]|uniref:Membrane insertase YidC/Oxa/ALB C-terminal domain-containing protein n=1 Tax=Parthenolecanium corni TaxID=536013 RepID=A0AAN9YBH8_9HEMI
MRTFAQTLPLRLPKILSQGTRRNLHHLSPTTALRKESSRLLRPHPVAPFTGTCSRCFSESIFKSPVAAATSDRLTQNEVVYAVQEKLIAFHDVSGLPWWAVIITSTVAIRSLLIFPLAAHQQYVIARIANMQKEMDTTVKDEVTKSVAKLAAENKLDEKATHRCYRRQMNDRRVELYRKYNCNPLKNLVLVFIQMPVWVTMSAAIRNINSMLPVQNGVAVQAYLEMKASGFSVLKDLTVPDSTYLLPVAVVITNLIIIQLNEMSGLHRRNIFRNALIMLFRIFSVASLPFIVHAPKCIILYWLTSSLFGLFQNILFIHPKTRKMLRIPHHSTLRKDPFAHIKNRFKSIYYFFKY